MKSRNSRGLPASLVLLPVSLLLMSSLLPAAAAAQDFRIYTRVYDEMARPDERTPAAERSAILTRSLSLFHAGRVYDYLESVGEVVIYEPVRRRFIILDPSRGLATEADLDEIRHFLKLATQETEDHVGRLLRSSNRATQQMLAHLQFQLDPQFETEYNAATQKLVLRNPRFRYDVRCSAGSQSEMVERYLDYADSTARLNYVLHPQLLLPEPRIRLNEQLRTRNLLPVEVELQTELASGHRIHRRAEHEIRIGLDDKDRSRIHQWETLLRSKNVQHVHFRDYQRALVAGQPPARR